MIMQFMVTCISFADDMPDSTRFIVLLRYIFSKLCIPKQFMSSIVLEYYRSHQAENIHIYEQAVVGCDASCYNHLGGGVTLEYVNACIVSS